VGQKATVSSDTLAGQKIPGYVSFISSEPEIYPEKRADGKGTVKLVYRIKVVIPNPTGSWKPGMPADAEIQRGTGNENSDTGD